MRRLRYNSSHFVCRADQLVQKEGKKPFMKNFRSLEMSEHRVRDDLASGNFGLGKKNTRFASPNAQILTPPPLVCGHPVWESLTGVISIRLLRSHAARAFNSKQGG